MDLLILVLIIGAAFLAAYGVWRERGASPEGWAILLVAAALLVGRLS